MRPRAAVQKIAVGVTIIGILICDAGEERTREGAQPSTPGHNHGLCDNK